MRFVLRLLVLFVVAVPAWAQDGDTPITASDLFNIRELGSVAPSPDGRYVVYTVRQAYHAGEGKEAKYGYRTHLWIAEAGGREAPRPLTRGDESASQPAWHPDGDRLAFVRTVDGKPQVFILPFEGGEAWQLTHAKQGASQPTWSPGGDLLLFASSLAEKDVREAVGGTPGWPGERPGRMPGDTRGATPDPDGSVAEIRAWLDANQDDNNPRVLDRLDLQGENDLEPGLSFRHWYVIAPTDSAEAAPVTRGFVSYSSAAWLADGTQLVVSGNTQVAQHPDRERQSNLYLVDVATGRVEPFLSLPGRSVFSPQPAPDGTAIAYLSSDLDDPGFSQTELEVYALDGQHAPLHLTDDFDRSVQRVEWSPEGRFIYFTAASDGGVPLYRVAPYGADLADADEVDEAADSSAVADTLALPGAPVFVDDAPDSTATSADSLITETDDEETGPIIERLTPFTQGVSAFAAVRSAVYYVVTEVENPYELYRAGLRFDAPRRLTDHNAAWLKTRRVSRPEAFSYVTPDSLTVGYWIMEPTFARAGRQYPLLVEIHGGPSAMWGPGESSMWHEFQLFAAKGYGIVYSNPRGSGGYGYDFQRANFQNWGHGPTADVLGAADRAAALPWVDKSKQVVTGGSYAGYLTAWIVGHDDRFKAAVAQRGVYDLRTFFGEGNAWRLVPSHFGGYPWDDDVFETLSEASTVDLVREEVRASAQAGDLDVDMFSEADEMDGVDADSTTRRLSVPEILARESPITYVRDIETPLLIIHGDVDRRTGFVQSEMLYRSLKALGKPVEYVRYPGAGHELSRSGNPKQRLDRLLRIYEFMERYVR